MLGYKISLLKMSSALRTCFELCHLFYFYWNWFSANGAKTNFYLCGPWSLLQYVCNFTNVL